MNADRSLTFISRVKNSLDAMHPTERRLAEFLLSFPGELASYTATELAQLANVSNATVTRLIRKLGYTNYDEARRHVRADKKGGAAIYQVGSESDIPNGLIGAHITQAKENLDLTFAMTSIAEIDQLAKQILNARRVWVVGFRASVAFANYFQWQVLQIVENVSVIPRSGQTLAEHIAGMGSDDCVVFIGLQRLVRGSDSLLGHMHKTGASIALISDVDFERKHDVKWHFKCGTSAPGPLFNHVSVMALLHLIAVRVVELASTTGRKRLTTIETLHDALDEL